MLLSLNKKDAVPPAQTTKSQTSTIPTIQPPTRPWPELSGKHFNGENKKNFNASLDEGTNKNNIKMIVNQRLYSKKEESSFFTTQFFFYLCICCLFLNFFRWVYSPTDRDQTSPIHASPSSSPTTEVRAQNPASFLFSDNIINCQNFAYVDSITILRL